MDKVIDDDELQKASTNLKTGKSCGLDQIANEMILCVFEVCPHIFKNLFNSLLTYGVFPDMWTKSMIVPIFKKGDKSDPTNYRGIALLSCLGKFFNLIINSSLTEFAKTNGIFQPERFGFIKGNRTSDNLAVLHSLVDHYCFKHRTKLYVSFIDFEKAYDKINRQVLLSKINKLGVQGNLYNIIESMYQNNQSCIRIGNKKTDFFQVNNGVKQGCVLSPTLFNIFLSDLPAIFRNPNSKPASLGETTIGSFFWADDIAIISESKEGLQNSLDNLQSYCQSNKIRKNVKKPNAWFSTEVVSYFEEANFTLEKKS